ncbi:MAG: M14 family zinc carboxypeptidase [Thermoleophilaceae bacterium]
MTLAIAVPASAAPRLDAYTAVVSAGELRTLGEAGYDITGQRKARRGIRVGLVLTRDQRAKLAQEGINTRLTRVKGGQTVQQFAARQAANGFQVWRSWDEPGGFRDQMYAAARENRRIAKLVRLGTTIQGREVLAVKLTQGARRRRDGKRPAVLYSSTQHAREWIASEVNRRLMNWYIDRWNARDRQVRRLLRKTELWFVLVANPDGYQYTFDVERLWRKNLRDNDGDGDGDGEITIADGVDLNRNYPNHWKYDEEGSSSIFSSETYRGTAPTSEPETAALKGLLDRVDFEFQVNYHSVGEWLLYAEGWQIATPTADDPIYFAMSGNLDEPAIPGFHPGLSSDVLYVTNGETTDYAHAGTGALAWTPELGDGCPDEDCGFVFPDNEAAVQAEFERQLPFARSVATSADDPDDPESVLGIETKPFYIKSDDPYKDGIPGANFTFDYSYGDPQPVQVLAKRSLGRVTLKYRINGGRTRSARTSEWDGGERYDPADVYYRVMRGFVRGTDPGDRVKVWFEADEDKGRGHDRDERGKGRGRDRDEVRSGSFTYRAVSDSNDDVLVVAAEDYTGASPTQSPGPHYVDYYVDAVEANGRDVDVYDIDARNRTAPDQLGVLSHYDAVLWYMGDDAITREAGWGPGNADRLALDQVLEARAYMNEGGRVLYTGKNAGLQFSPAAGAQFYDPKGEGPCNPNPGYDPRRCLLLQGSGDNMNDVLEYWFGSYVYVAGDGDRDDGGVFDVDGIDDPFTGLSWAFNGPDSAGNQDTGGSFVSTSGILPPDEYPQFTSWPSSRWSKPGGPFEPHTGSQYVYSQIADVSYKRLTREIAVPASGGNLTFWTSYDTEGAWDHLFVEARTAGGDDWTTLPDANGHTTQATGDSCAAGWSEELHPHLNHYVTYDSTAGTCTPTGTTGEWHAASGNSSGWQQWSVNLDEWAGETVEISIAYASDWAVQNLGVFVDDVTLPDGTSTSFETGFDGWQVTGPPEGSGPNANNWIRTDATGFPVGASITTPDSLLMGYGFEGISTQEKRNEVMGRVLGHLLGGEG